MEEEETAENEGEVRGWGRDRATENNRDWRGKIRRPRGEKGREKETETETDRPKARLREGTRETRERDQQPRIEVETETQEDSGRQEKTGMGGQRETDWERLERSEETLRKMVIHPTHVYSVPGSVPGLVGVGPGGPSQEQDLQVPGVWRAPGLRVG